MVYELMHKDIVVAEIDIGDDARINKIIDIFNLDHFPFSTVPSKKTPKDPTGLRRWWNNRRIPMSRDDLERSRGIILPEGSTTGTLLLACNGLSLSDSYWIKERGSSLSFAEVNFFENDYSYDLGDALVGKRINGKLNLSSPDTTSEGNLLKRWKIINGKRVLLKSGSKPHRYEVYNEVIASLVCSHLGIYHVDYHLIEDDGYLYCACEDFIMYGQDFVTAYMVSEESKKANEESLYQFIVRRYAELGVEDAKKQIDKMLLLDFLLGNEDRHLNNFGLIRDAKTLRFLCCAPIFDTGSCLGYLEEDDTLAYSKPRPWKPFSSKAHPRQIDYFDELPIDTPHAILSLVSAVSSLLDTFDGMPGKRKKAILRFLSSRVSDVTKKFGIVDSMHSSTNLPIIEERIVGFVLEHGGRLQNAEELCSSLGISKITSLRHINALVRLRKLRRVGSKKTGYWELV